MDTPDPSATPKRPTFQDAASLITIVSATTVAFSAIYEWGYFWVIGRKFQTVMSATDYLNEAVEWVPISLIVVSFYLYHNLSMKGLERVAEKLLGRPGISMAQMITIVAISPIIALLFILFTSSPGVFDYALAFSVIWVPYIWFWRRRIIGDVGLHFISREIVFIAPVILVSVFTLGLDAGYRDETRFRNVYLISTVSTPTITPVLLLRNFQKGVLIRLPGKMMNEFVRWEDVRSLSRPSFPPTEESRACRWFSFGCPDRPEPFVP